MHLRDGPSETEPLLKGGSSDLVFSPPPSKSFEGVACDTDQYGEFGGFKSVDEGTATQTDPPSTVPASRRKRVIIVGAGISGTQQAAVLLRDGYVKHDDIQIFDALEDVGGVWQKHTYPGCGCDVPAMIYTTSFYIYRKFTNYFADRDTIQEYYSDFAKDYGLYKCAQFSTFVKTCVWDEEAMVWHVTVQTKAGEVQHWIADVVAQCVGSLDRPKWGTTPGRENFKGTIWHTANWNHDYDMTGKRIAVIGCGPSASQAIPTIVEKSAHTTVYMRTPPVCNPRNDYAFSSWYRWALKWVPFFAWFVRTKLNVSFMSRGWKMATDGSKENDDMTNGAIRWLKSQIKDPELLEKLYPTSKIYCKRPLRLDHFYSSLAKPNASVLRDTLVRYTDKGVVSKDKKTGEETEREYDAIIFGTGFNVAQYLEHEKVVGIGGLDLQEKWKEHPEALYGLATSSFPNFFMCFGPNSANLWGAQHDNWERQARFAAWAVREVILRERKGKKFAMHPKLEREREYNIDVQRQQQGRFVWMRPDCTTYYNNDAGWNTYILPYSWFRFGLMVRRIIWKEWNVIEKPIKDIKS